jgi:hypothetical protein
MVAKRVLAGFAIFFAGLTAIATLAAQLLNSSVVLAALAKVLRPEVDFAPAALGLGCFAVLAGFWCIFLVSINACVPQETIPSSRRSQGVEAGPVAAPSQSRRGNLLQP